jgi:hypothetical protein
VILDRCPDCKRPVRAYCERLGRPCVTRVERQEKAGDRNGYHREYYQRIRRESGWGRCSTFKLTSVAPLEQASAPNDITA